MPLTRRRALSGLATLLVSSGFAEEKHGLLTDRPQGRSAVIYLSRSGNTRVVAGQLQRALYADIFELRMAQHWPEDYEEMVAWASKLHKSGALPPLTETVPDLAQYGTIFLGSPIWGSALPSPVRTFLTTRDLSGKVLTPFLTYGCCGIGDALETIAQLAPRAKLTKPFTLKCDQERDTLNSVNAWLELQNSGPVK